MELDIKLNNYLEIRVEYELTKEIPGTYNTPHRPIEVDELEIKEIIEGSLDDLAVHVDDLRGRFIEIIETKILEHHD